MKHLYLMRHAKSSHADKSLNDHARPLNDRGRNDAALMGRILKEKGVDPGVIISSSARRAKMTAELLAAELNYAVEAIEIEDKIYENDPDVLMAIIRSLPDNYNGVMLIGHNPSFHELIEQLSANMYHKVPTAAVAALQFDANAWRDVADTRSRLLWLEYPRKYKI